MMSAFFNLHTHTQSNSSEILELVNQYPWKFNQTFPYYSIGIHPWHIDQNRLDKDFEILTEKLNLTSCLAIGECGLDKRIETPIEIQKEVFIKHIELAEKFNKPLIIHCVAAFEELIVLKKKFKVTVPIVIHGFSKNEILAKQLIKESFYLSFGKYLVQNPELKTVFQYIPNDRYFLETDTTNIVIETVYNLAAEYKNCSLAEIQQQINSNFAAVFSNS